MSDRDGLETIRVVFPDIHGIFRGKTVVSRVLDSVLESGIGNAGAHRFFERQGYAVVSKVFMKRG